MRSSLPHTFPISLLFPLPIYCASCQLPAAPVCVYGLHWPSLTLLALQADQRGSGQIDLQVQLEQFLNLMSSLILRQA